MAPLRFSLWLARLFVLAAIGVSIYLNAGGLLAVPFLFLLVVPFEKMFPRHRGQKVRRDHASLDVSYGLASPALAAIGVAVAIFVGLISLAWVPGLLLRPLVGLLPGAAMPFVGIALFDIAIYWVHRWSHEVPALWRFHSIHHSTKHLDWVSGFRNHPFDGAIVAPPFVLLLAAGFDPAFTGVLAVIQFATGLFLHANVRFRFRPFHRLIITPEFHHWHHANETDARNSNYSVFLPLWDMVFGSYYMPRNKRPLKYGVDEDVPMTMAGQFKYPFRGVRSPWQMIRHPFSGLRAAWRTVRRTLAGVRKATFRPRRRQPARGELYDWALRAPQQEPVS